MLIVRFLILVLLMTAWLARADTVVSVFVPDQKAANKEFSEALQRALARLSVTVSVREVQAIDGVVAGGLVVAVGSQAFQEAQRKSAGRAVIGALLPRHAYERVLQQAAAGVPTSAVFLDQPEERQLALVSLLPGPPATIGVIRSGNAVISWARLRAAAARYRFKLQEESLSADSDLAAAIQNVSGQTDVILATPDPAVFSPQTISGILLSAYRSRVPLVGFSPAYTRAGALLSLHSSVQQLAAQTAEMVRVVAAGGALPAPQVPTHFEVSVNRQVARSLGVELPSEIVLVDHLRALEREK